MSSKPAFSPSPAGRILVVDDDVQIRRLLSSLLTSHGYQVGEAGSAEEASTELYGFGPDLILLDVRLPDKSGIELLEEIRNDTALRLLPVVMMTGAVERAERIRAIAAGATDFISKPFANEELLARIRSLVQLKFFADSLEDAEQIIIALAKVIDARDPYTAHHSERVSLYAGLLGEKIGLAGLELEAVRRGGLFHDIGKIAVRDSVLLKPGRLTPEEFEEIKRHPVQGRLLLEPMRSLSYALPVIYHHHEKYDGSGYPEGLTGEAIPMVARVTTVADVFDALTTNRTYRSASTREEALSIMTAEARKGWWDARLLEELRGCLETLPLAAPALAV
ncbi:MAG: HD domain-containing phosphohydrolase [Thermoanaerobaculia bacterium]